MLFDLDGSAYKIPQETARRLCGIDILGERLEECAHATHTVVPFPTVTTPQVWFKSLGLLSLDPGMEMAVYGLYKILLGDRWGGGAPPTRLVVVEGTQILGEKQEEYRHLILQASQHIVGEPLKKVIASIDEAIPDHSKTEAYTQAYRDRINRSSFSAMVLCSFLFNPSDYHGNNLILTSKNIVGVDNDEMFTFRLAGIKHSHSLRLKNLLYLMPLMNDHIDPEVKDHFLSLTPDSVITAWLAYIHEQNTCYENLFHKGILRADIDLPLSLPLKFRAEMIPELKIALTTLQKHLIPGITHNQLFEVMAPSFFALYGSFLKRAEWHPQTAYDLLNLAEQLEGRVNLREPVRTIDAHRVVYVPLQQGLEASIEQLQNEPDAQKLHEKYKDRKGRGTQGRNEYAGRRYDVTEIIARFSQQLKDQKEKDQDERRLRQREHLECKVRHMISRKEDGKDDATVAEFGKIALESQSSFQTLEEHAMLGGHDSFVLFLLEKEGNCFQDLVSPQLMGWYYGKHVRQKESDPLSHQICTLFDQLPVKSQERSFEEALHLILPYAGDVPAAWQEQSRFRFTETLSEGGILHKRMRILNPDVVDQVWGPDDFKRVDHGRRIVVRAQIGSSVLYLKVLPELPGIEEEVGTLMRGVVGYGTPHTRLLRMEGQGRSFPVLVSEGIEGDLLQEDSVEEKLKHLDPQKFSELILMTMLTMPEDGTRTNYKAREVSSGSTTYEIIPIDNDRAFVAPIAKEEIDAAGVRNAIQVKTVLYCLDAMGSEIDPRVRERFISHDPDSLILDWLLALIRKRGEYEFLFPTRDERHQLYTHHKSFIGLPFRSESIALLLHKFWEMRRILESNEHLKHQHLLEKLEPILGRRYGKILQNRSLRERFDTVDGRYFAKDGPARITVSNTADLLSSMKITTKEAREWVTHGFTGSPIQAIIEAFETIEHKTSILKLQDVTTPEKLERTLQSSVRKEFSLQEQKTFLRHLTQRFATAPALREVTRLELQEMHALERGSLLRFPDILPELLYLNLSAASLGSRGLANFLLRTPALKALVVENCPNIRQIVKRMPIVGQPPPLDLPYLQVLHLAHNENLRCLKLNTPDLIELDLSETPRLTNDIDIIAPQLKRLYCEGSGIQDDKLIELLQGCRRLQDLRVSEDRVLRLWGIPGDDQEWIRFLLQPMIVEISRKADGRSFITRFLDWGEGENEVRQQSRRDLRGVLMAIAQTPDHPHNWEAIQKLYWGQEKNWEGKVQTRRSLCKALLTLVQSPNHPNRWDAIEMLWNSGGEQLQAQNRNNLRGRLIAIILNDQETEGWKFLTQQWDWRWKGEIRQAQNYNDLREILIVISKTPAHSKRWDVIKMLWNSGGTPQQDQNRQDLRDTLMCMARDPDHPKKWDAIKMLWNTGGDQQDKNRQDLHNLLITVAKTPKYSERWFAFDLLWGFQSLKEFHDLLTASIFEGQHQEVTWVLNSCLGTREIPQWLKFLNDKWSTATNKTQNRMAVGDILTTIILSDHEQKKWGWSFIWGKWEEDYNERGELHSGRRPNIQNRPDIREILTTLILKGSSEGWNRVTSVWDRPLDRRDYYCGYDPREEKRRDQDRTDLREVLMVVAQTPDHPRQWGAIKKLWNSNLGVLQIQDRQKLNAVLLDLARKWWDAREMLWNSGGEQQDQNREAIGEMLQPLVHHAVELQEWRWIKELCKQKWLQKWLGGNGLCDVLLKIARESGHPQQVEAISVLWLFGDKQLQQQNRQEICEILETLILFEQNPQAWQYLESLCADEKFSYCLYDALRQMTEEYKYEVLLKIARQSNHPHRLDAIRILWSFENNKRQEETHNELFEILLNLILSEQNPQAWQYLKTLWQKERNNSRWITEKMTKSHNNLCNVLMRVARHLDHPKSWEAIEALQNSYRLESEMHGELCNILLEIAQNREHPQRCEAAIILWNRWGKGRRPDCDDLRAVLREIVSDPRYPQKWKAMQALWDSKEPETEQDRRSHCELMLQWVHYGLKLEEWEMIKNLWDRQNIKKIQNRRDLCPIIFAIAQNLTSPYQWDAIRMLWYSEGKAQNRQDLRKTLEEISQDCRHSKKIEAVTKLRKLDKEPQVSTCEGDYDALLEIVENPEHPEWENTLEQLQALKDKEVHEELWEILGTIVKGHTPYVQWRVAVQKWWQLQGWCWKLPGLWAPECRTIHRPVFLAIARDESLYMRMRVIEFLWESGLDEQVEDRAVLRPILWSLAHDFSFLEKEHARRRQAAKPHRLGSPIIVETEHIPYPHDSWSAIELLWNAKDKEATKDRVELRLLLLEIAHNAENYWKLKATKFLWHSGFTEQMKDRAILRPVLLEIARSTEDEALNAIKFLWNSRLDEQAEDRNEFSGKLLTTAWRSDRIWERCFWEQCRAIQAIKLLWHSRDEDQDAYRETIRPDLHKILDIEDLDIVDDWVKWKVIKLLWNLGAGDQEEYRERFREIVHEKAASHYDFRNSSARKLLRNSDYPADQELLMRLEQ